MNDIYAEIAIKTSKKSQVFHEIWIKKVSHKKNIQKEIHQDSLWLLQ